MRPSFEASIEFFRSFSNPRRKRVKIMNDRGVMEWVYRKVALSEEDRGEPYPLAEISTTSLSDFGIGIGIYYVQLLLYALLFLICGFILTPSMTIYTNKYEHSGLTNSTIIDAVLLTSATCEPGRAVTATSGCPNGQASCSAMYRDNETKCEMYSETVMLDLIMCMVFVVGVFAIAFIEDYCIEELDESVQTAQDYAIVVQDPPADAVDPQEWAEFFGRFGQVRYVTITRKNDEITAVLLAKYELIVNFMTFYTKLSGHFQRYCDDHESSNGAPERRRGGELGGPVSVMQNAYHHAIEAENLEVNEAFMRSALSTLFAHAADIFPVGRVVNNMNTSGATSNESAEFAAAPGHVMVAASKVQPMGVGELSLEANALISESERVSARLREIDLEVNKLSQHVYPVCRVYVVFAQEFNKRICIQSLEVPDLVSSGVMADTTGSTRALFRGEVLEVLEPPEPNNILWRNLEISDSYRRLRQFCSICLTAGVLTGCYFIISLIPLKQSTNIGIVVGIIDTLLPFVLTVFTEYELALDQDDLQDSLLSKLFIARILTSTVFSYMALSWGNFLDAEVLASVVSIQISASFTAPLINFLDLPGLMNRHILSRVFPADDQMESNQRYFKGAAWMLAERYTSLGKIIFVSMVYALLTPAGLFIAATACFLTFFLDRFMLLRRWAPAPMMDACLAARFRQQVMFAVSVHMYISLIFITGWPFDSANLTSPEGVAPATYSKEYKDPSLWVMNMDKASYMAPGTQTMFQPYKICTYGVLLVTAYMMVGHRIVRMFRQAFFSNDDVVGDATRIPYTVVEGIETYCPIVSLRSSVREADHTLIAADIESANHAHIKPLLHALQMRSFMASQGVTGTMGHSEGMGQIARGGEVPVNLFNLSLLLPRNSWHNCMSSVTYYRAADDDDEDSDLDASIKEKPEVGGGSDKSKFTEKRRGQKSVDALSRLANISQSNALDPSQTLTMEIELGSLDLDAASDDVNNDSKDGGDGVRRSINKKRGNNSGRLIVKSSGSAAPSNVLLQLARAATNAPADVSSVSGDGPSRALSLREKVNSIQPDTIAESRQNKKNSNIKIHDFESFKDWIEETAPAVSKTIGPIMLRNCYEELNGKLKDRLHGANSSDVGKATANASAAADIGVGRTNAVTAAASGGVSADQYLAMLRVFASLNR